MGLNVDKQEAQKTIRDAGPTEIQGTCRTQFTCASHFPKDRKDGFLDFDDAGHYRMVPCIDYTYGEEQGGPRRGGKQVTCSHVADRK